MNTDVKIVGFDYGTLSMEDAQEARAVAERVRGRLQAAIIETGRDLEAVKSRIGHGGFGAWLKAEFGMSERTAQNYIQAAAVFGVKPEIVAVLPAVTVYALAAKSAPESIRADVIRQVEQGHRPEPNQIYEALRQHKEQECQRKEAKRQAAKWAKLTPEQKAELELKDKRRRQSRAQREEAELAAKLAAEKCAAEDAAAMLAERLGPDLDRFVGLHRAAGYHFGAAINAVSKGL